MKFTTWICDGCGISDFGVEMPAYWKTVTIEDRMGVKQVLLKCPDCPVLIYNQQDAVIEFVAGTYIE